MCAGTYYLPPSTRHLLLATTYIVVDLHSIVGGTAAGLGGARDHSRVTQRPKVEAVPDS